MLASTISNRSVSSVDSKKFSRPTPAYSVQATRDVPASTNGAQRSPLPDGVIGAAANGTNDYRTALDQGGGAVEWLQGKKHPSKIGQKLAPHTNWQDAPLETPSFADSETFPPQKEWPRPPQVKAALQDQRLPQYMRDVPEPLPVDRKSVKGPAGVGGVGLRLLKAPGKAPCVSDFSPKARKDPAMKAKICIGDVVVMVNGRGVTGRHSIEDVEQMLAGPRGSSCALRLLRRVPMADVYTRRQLLEQDGTTESEEGVVYGLDLPRLDDEISTIVHHAPDTDQGPDARGERLIVRVPDSKGVGGPDDFGEEPLWAVEQATRRGLVYEAGKGFVVPAQLLQARKPDNWDELDLTGASSDPDAHKPPLAPIDPGRPLEMLSADQDLAVRHEQMVQQFNDLRNQRGGSAHAPAEVTALMQGILEHQERSVVPAKNLKQEPLAHEVAKLKESNQEITRAALSIYGRFLKHQPVEEQGGRADAEEVRKLKTAAQLAREDAEAKGKELVKLRAQSDVDKGKLQLEKSTVEARLRAEIDVLREGLDNAREYAVLREKMEELLEVKESVIADRGELQRELDRVKANRIHDGKMRWTASNEYGEGGPGGMTRAIVADIETLSLTNAELVLDLHRLKEEKRQLERDKAELRSDRARFEEIVDRKNEEIQGLQNDLVELREMDHEHHALQTELQRLRDEHQGLAERAEAAERVYEEEKEMLANQASDLKRLKQELHQQHQELVAQIRAEHEEGQRELRELRAEQQDLQSRAAEAELKYEELTREQMGKEEAMKTQLAAAQAEAELQRRTVTDLRKSVIKEGENNRQAFNVLQGDIKTSNETLRTALDTALAELKMAKHAVQTAESDVAEKNKVVKEQAELKIKLQESLNLANAQILAAAQSAGCLACRRALNPAAIAPALQQPAGYPSAISHPAAAP